MQHYFCISKPFYYFLDNFPIKSAKYWNPSFKICFRNFVITDIFSTHHLHHMHSFFFLTALPSSFQPHIEKANNSPFLQLHSSRLHRRLILDTSSLPFLCRFLIMDSHPKDAFCIACTLFIEVLEFGFSRTLINFSMQMDLGIIHFKIYPSLHRWFKRRNFTVRNLDLQLFLSMKPVFF